MNENSIFKIAVIGLGYVGLPLSNMFVQKGHTVYGIDVDTNKINLLSNNQSYLSDFSDEDIEKMFSQKNFHVGSSFQVINDVDVVIICVPTPLDKDTKPDLRFIRSAITNSQPFLKPGQLVVLESSTYPGTTEEEIVPLIQSNGFEVGNQVFVAYSPERINPGDKTMISTIPKVVGGVTSACTNLAKTVYESIFDTVVVVSSPKVAELTKILENYQRFVNISVMNQLLLLCDEMDINLWEVIAAASTKPYGFTPYYPGPGIGGHCIPVDPLYLLWKAGQYNIDLEFISLSHKINEQMPQFIRTKVEKTLNKPLKMSHILAIGVTYKKDVNDLRESVALRVIEQLKNAGAHVEFHDPFVSEIKSGNSTMKSINLSSSEIKQADCTLILTDHSCLPYELIAQESSLVIDTRNAMKSLHGYKNIVLI
ncbi:nucleotide sugar dehydrogenase [Bacillus sp. CECT 9360]|uniref:nucleotide sugar dehydrogenase n=1 Tax=Bacillus sp. CECT 9360 TaxID=2845821 RepID=UPI001E294059|nr:nucleotide sugar dehydrogenase [Bacillus sp. CECT 9360]CAH0345468.1 UDP-N-acetyl-D-glucosamine 6-dehydrogenase [Bacillus sp. CECT 9360]